MLAVRFDHFGPPAENLQIQEVPKLTLTAEEVLVEVHAAGVNPSDAKNVLGNMENTTLPRTPGRDFAGIVVEGPKDLVGKEVWGTGGDIGFTRDGTHAEYLVLPKEAVRSKPQNLSMAEAGSIGVTYVTAWLSIMDAAQLLPGETLLVIGATGGVGSAAIQIAKWKGAGVIGTIRRESDHQQAQQNGVDIVVNLADQDLPEAVMAATDGQGANVILDTVGGPMFEPCLRALAHKGRQLQISSPAKERRVCFDLIDFYHRESRLLGVDSRKLGVVECASVLAALTPGFESNALRPPAAGISSYPLKEVIAAYEQVLKSGAGRVMLAPRSS
ncbi:MAG: zinc-binding alcohol dehydrogenase family protein [Chroococcidiopsidaceae cyanobacterium CP_BM_ER_R8_30]|nr:zinc-binding alcohol dehydrogenase family protein [Chroococcidiopsidaceae cyanobacterium CP_BM_ER_R8_30]